MRPGVLEIVIILFVILLLFGARKLPDLARALGRSLSEFKRGREDGDKALDSDAGAEGASEANDVSKEA